MNTALVIIDIQNDYFEKGNYPLNAPVQAATNAKSILEHFRASNLPIFHVQHIINAPDAAFFKANTTGAQIHSLVQPQGNETVIVKSKASSFHGTTLHEQLQTLNIEHLVICGMMSHHCVESTARTAVYLNYKITVIQDACTTRSLEFNGELLTADTIHNVYMAGLKGFGNVISTSEYLDN